MNRIKRWFGFQTVRKKVLLLSKLVGVIIVLFYILTLEFSQDKTHVFWLGFLLMALVILGVDGWLKKMISNPLEEINAKAKQMAELNLTEKCHVNSKDEFGELSQNLNIMSTNLSETLDKLEQANQKLEQDVEREKQLLIQRKELTDDLSHELKTPVGLILAYAEGLREEKEPSKNGAIP